MEYSDNVFFLPWDGGKYEEGIIPSGENLPGDLKPLKLMVLGKEHYCLDENHCKSRNHEQDYYLNSLKILAPLQTDPTKIKDKIVDYYQVRKEIKEKIEQDKEFSTYFNTEIWESSFRKDIKYWDKIYIVYKWLEFYKKNFANEYSQASKHLKEKELSWLENHDELGAIEKILRVHSLDRMDNDPQKDLRLEDLEEDAKKVQEILSQTSDFEDKAAQYPQCHMHELYECSLCKNKHPCSHCFQMPICRYMTRRELYGYINGENESPSHKKFRESLYKNSNREIWNQLVFSNFYQQSMPNKRNNAPGDDKRAMQAFVEIVKQCKPDIIITWGNAPFDVILQDSGEVLRNEKISLRNLKNLPPHLQIQIGSETYMLPFAILTGYDQDHPQKSCLLVSTGYHPSARYFKPAEFNKCLGKIWEHYEKLKKWVPPFDQAILDKLDKFLKKPKPAEFDTLQKELRQNIANQAILDILNSANGTQRQEIKECLNKIKDQPVKL